MLIIGFAPLWLCQAGHSAAAVAKPNILFILTDDLGYGDLGVFFQNARASANNRAEPWHLTPHLDTLAADGVQMCQHYCPAPVCAPSRASLLLGVTQGHANVRDNQFDKELEENHTLATVLKEAGYATVCIGKWGLQGSGSNAVSWPAYPTKRGFDYFFGYVRHSDGHEHYPKEGVWVGAKQVWDGTNEISSELDKCYTADLWTARAKQWILDHERTNAAQPFFMYLAYDTPHAVCEIPTQPYPAGGGTNGGLQWIGMPGHFINTASGTVDSYTNAAYANATYDDDNNPATPEVPWPYVYKRYATSINRLDDCIGDLRQLLQDLNISTNTFIVFTSDNGPSIESYLPQGLAANFFDSYGPFDGIKRDCWEGGLRVPTIACWPGHLPAGPTNNLASGFWDWLPTFADLAGEPAPARSDGVSLLPSLTGAGVQRTPTVYVEYYQGGTTPSYSEFLPAHRGRRRNQMQAIRLGDYLGVRYDVTAQTNDFEIYNVVTDPQEGINLATDPAYGALQQQMKDTVLQERMPNGSAPRPYDSEYVPATNAAPLAPGVEWRTYTNAFPWVPELTTLPAAATGITNRATLAVRPRDSDIGVLFSGFIEAPADGDYTFYLTANSGALLRIHEATVVDADFGYVAGTERSGTIRLKAGKHPYRLYYIHGTGGTPALGWNWQGPGIAKQAVPDSVLFRVGVAPPGPPAANDDAASTTQSTSVLIDVLANDFDDGTPQPLSLQSVTQPAGGSCQIVSNKILYTPAPGFLGQDSFEYTITDGSATATAKVTVRVYFTNSDFVWFPFNQTAGLTTAEAGSGLSATLNGFVDDSSPWVAGRFGRGIQFDGANTVVAVDPSCVPPIGQSARTTAAWIKATAIGAIIAWGPNTTSLKWMMRLDNNSATYGCLRVEIGGGYVAGSQNLVDGQWHHVAAVLPYVANPNATDILLYVDGVRQAPLAQVASPINTTAAPVTIGLDAQNRHFQGVIDEVRIYRRALSNAEVAALAAATNQSAAAWYRRYYGDGAINWTGDSDSDGFSQLAEYAFGGNPRVVDAPLQLQAQAVNGQFQLTYPRLVVGTTELTYEVESSSDLRSWSPAAGTETAVVPVPGMPDYQWATFEPTASISDTPRFFRVRSNFP